METVIIKSTLVKIRIICLAIFTVFLVIALITAYISFEGEVASASSRMASWNLNWDWVVEKYGIHATPEKVALSSWNPTPYILIALGGAVLAGLFYFSFHNTELNVTDKRVYGKTSWGKRVDLPLDSISAVGTSLFKGIAVATSSGRIKFGLLKNRDEIHKAISDLLIERQKKTPASTSTTIKQEIPQSNADEIKKYKDLLDSGVITQEEFDAKKKQLLGL